MKAKSLYIIIFFLILGILISQLKVIPSSENVQTMLVVSSFILALVISLLFLFKLWIGKNKEKTTNLTQQLIRTGIIIVLFPLAWLFTMPNFSKPELVNGVTLEGKTIYVYHDSCFPPDSVCECDTYGSLIYRKNQYLPLMHLVLKTDFYVGSVQLNNGELIVKASDICTKDIGKIKHLKKQQESK